MEQVQTESLFRSAPPVCRMLFAENFPEMQGAGVPATDHRAVTHFQFYVIPAKAGIHAIALDASFRWHDILF